MPTPFELHILSRGYTPHLDAWADCASELVTFPLFGWAGKMVGYQRYNWRSEKTRSNVGRYFTWVSDLYKEWGWWGLRNVRVSETGPVFVTEGVWNAAKVQNTGYSCIATLTATLPPSTIQCIKYAVNRPLIALCDNDPESKAGLALAKWCTHSFVTPSPYKDVGDMEQGEVNHYIRWCLDEIKHG